MAHFLHHTSCPRCNSRDNLAIYSDGSGWCFGCRFKLGTKVSPYVEQMEKEEHPLPKDLIQEYPKQVIEWVMKYDVTIPELIRRNVYWSPSTQLLIFKHEECRSNSISKNNFSFKDPNTTRIPCLQTNKGDEGGSYNTRRTLALDKCYSEDIKSQTFATGRSFSKSHKYKYKSFGNKNSVWCGYPCKTEDTFTIRDLRARGIPNKSTNITPVGNSRQRNIGNTPPGTISSCVLVEDCLSAIKIARQSDSYPLMTSTLSLPEIKRLAGVYDAFLVWLDGNKYDNAQALARKFQLLGKKATAVYTQGDPKEYSDKKIAEVLDTAAENVLY